MARYQAAQEIEEAARVLARARVRYEIAVTAGIIDYQLPRAEVARLIGRSVSTVDRWLSTERERRNLLDPQLPSTQTL